MEYILTLRQNMADFSSREDDSKRKAWRANLSVLSTNNSNFSPRSSTFSTFSTITPFDRFQLRLDAL